MASVRPSLESDTVVPAASPAALPSMAVPFTTHGLVAESRW